MNYSQIESASSSLIKQVASDCISLSYVSDPSFQFFFFFRRKSISVRNPFKHAPEFIIITYKGIYAHTDHFFLCDFGKINPISGTQRKLSEILPLRSPVPLSEWMKCIDLAEEKRGSINKLLSVQAT